jgi:hypothetical protein
VRVGVCCPPGVGSVSEALQLATIARKGGGRLWLSCSRPTQSTHLAAALLGAGFNIPLGIIVSEPTDGRQLVQSVAEIGLLSRQKVIVGWNDWNASAIPTFLEESKLAREARLVGGAVFDHPTLLDSSTTFDQASFDFSHIIRLHAGVDYHASLDEDNIKLVDFIFYTLPSSEPPASGESKLGGNDYEDKLRALLERMSIPLGVGRSTLDRLEEQELVLGLDSSAKGMPTARELFILSHCIDVTTDFVSAKRLAMIEKLSKG